MDDLARHEPGMHHGHGWPPGGPRHRWLEPFVLVLIAQGCGHGYALSLECAKGTLADHVERLH